jgi:hypothetical protein
MQVVVLAPVLDRDLVLVVLVLVVLCRASWVAAVVWIQVLMLL